MKTLLFNGCSFTAGDEIVYKEYCEFTRWDGDWGKPTEGQLTAYRDYKENFRPKYNMSAICANMLGTTVVDLSQDGNSNYSIALRTVNYINLLSSSEKENLHVCVGWTEPVRRARWCKKPFNCLSNIHAMMYDNPFFSEHRDYIKSVLIDGDDIDHLIDYIQNLIMLENYLKTNKITYTFWRALGGRVPEQNILDLRSEFILNKDISLDENWLSFRTGNLANSLSLRSNYVKEQHFRYLDYSWQSGMSSINYISPRNSHPNKLTIEELSNRIVSHIQENHGR
jgi:hypothetical protein